MDSNGSRWSHYDHQMSQDDHKDGQDGNKCGLDGCGVHQAKQVSPFVNATVSLLVNV